MAEPPRLPAILLPWDKSIIYFVTMCVKDRRQVLATPTVFHAMKETIAGSCQLPLQGDRVQFRGIGGQW
jgi:hypothetical protein